MQDRFNFRVWDKDRRKMFTCMQINFTEGAHCSNKVKDTECSIHLMYQPHLELMQCTGLKDKNGKLIYEGDIIKIFHVSSTMQPSGFIGVVSYNNKKGRWEIEKNRKSGWFYEDNLYEVLGNIYENPTLLIS